jgi:hypothetical protein
MSSDIARMLSALFGGVQHGFVELWLYALVRYAGAAHRELQQHGILVETGIREPRGNRARRIRLTKGKSKPLGRHELRPGTRDATGHRTRRAGSVATRRSNRVVLCSLRSHV